MARRLDVKIIKKIKILRRKGYSIPEISVALNTPKTTVFIYSKGVQMSQDALKEWNSKRGGSRKIRLLKEKQALINAEKAIGKLSKKDKLLFISALYWAEGNKKDFMLSNTDPNLIKFFVESIKEIFGIENDRLRLSVRIYEDMDKEKCLSFWSKLIGLPIDKFQNVYILKGKKQGKLEFGMCRIRVTKGGDYLKQLVAVNKTVANY